jgi:heterodisulfide reductase subunit A
MDERAFGKEYGAYFVRAREQHGIQYTRCRVSGVAEDPVTHDLVLTYADAGGHRTEERFDMVVLATGLQPPDSARELAEMLAIELNEHGFCQTDKFTPVQTTRPGVFVCGAFSSPKEIAETILDASGAAAEVMRLLNEHLRAHPYTREWPFLSHDDLPPERDVSGEPPRVGVFACSCGETMSEVLTSPRSLPLRRSGPASWSHRPSILHAFPKRWGTSATPLRVQTSTAWSSLRAATARTTRCSSAQCARRV